MTATTCSAAEYRDALASFEHAAERLSATDPVMLSSQGITDALPALESAARKVTYAQNRLAQAAVEHRVPDELGYTGLKELLVQRLHLSGGEARDRVHGSRSRVPRHERGVAPEPRYPLVAEAQRHGEISERHAAVIERVFHSCRKRLEIKDEAVLEEILTTAARSASPEDIAAVGKRAIDLIDPDGAEPEEQVIARARGLHLGHQDGDLMSPLTGDLSPEARRSWTSCSRSSPGRA